MNTGFFGETCIPANDTDTKGGFNGLAAQSRAIHAISCRKTRQMNFPHFVNVACKLLPDRSGATSAILVIPVSPSFKNLQYARGPFGRRCDPIEPREIPHRPVSLRRWNSIMPPRAPVRRVFGLFFLSTIRSFASRACGIRS